MKNSADFGIKSSPRIFATLNPVSENISYKLLPPEAIVKIGITNVFNSKYTIVL